jgi:hypothetical protein
MPIIKALKADNGIAINYHNWSLIEIRRTADTALLTINSHTDEAAAIAALPIAWQSVTSIPTWALAGDVVSDAIEHYLTEQNDSPYYGGVITTDKTLSVEAAKQRKNLQINKARLDANRTAFTFAGKQVACDELSMLDISVTNGEISLTRAMPEDWVGGWKTIDDSYVAIPDVATWTLFYKAMAKQGKLNFKHAQDLKKALALATTLSDVDTINW